MNVIKRSALVPYSVRQMFELVNNIEDYPRFLPWCRASHIINNNDNVVEATLEIARGGIHKTFTTRNYLSPWERIDITLVSGPFRRLVGHWTFLELQPGACKVSIELEFEFTGNIFDKMFQPIFKSIANSLVESFCKRAEELYGK